MESFSTMADDKAPAILGEPSQKIDVTKLTREDILRLVGQRSSKLTYAPKESKRSKSDAWNRFEEVLVDGKQINLVKCNGR